MIEFTLEPGDEVRIGPDVVLKYLGRTRLGYRDRRASLGVRAPATTAVHRAEVPAPDRRAPHLLATRPDSPLARTPRLGPPIRRKGGAA